MKYIVMVSVIMSLGMADVHRHGSIHYFTPERYENATTISFSNGVVFDTRQGEPALPAHLMIDTYEDVGCYLVQMTGPITESDKTVLALSGCQILGYIPYYTLLVKADRLQIQEIMALPNVNWTGMFHPAYKMQKELFTLQGFGRVAVQISPSENIDDMARMMKEYGFSVVDKKDHAICKSIDVIGLYQNTCKIARIPGVLWLQIPAPIECPNDDVQWVVQTGWQSTVPGSEGWRIWNQGLCGDGIVLGNCDSGVNTEHDAFYDPTCPINAPGLYPDHRKVVAYNLYEGAAFGDPPYVQYMIPYHGTFTTGTLAGDDSINGGTSLFDGVAKDARLFMLDLVDEAGAWPIETLTNLVSVWDSVYLGHGLPFKIQQSSAQIGKSNTQGTYLLEDASTDAYDWEHKDFLQIFPAGNNGAPMTILTMGLAKNVICGGGCLNGTYSNIFWTGSSRGPTQDNRIKPNIVGPSTSIWSADGGTTSGYTSATGTCGASVSTNGALGLIRQYLLAGFYPSGAANPADSIHYQSSALLRSMAIVSADPNVGSYEVPSFEIGWGRLDIDSVLYFTGDTRKLIILDDTIGLNTGQAITDSFKVLSSIPLRICLAWTDTAAAPNANPTLVNDLNLELIAPDGTQYRGNQYSGGQSIPNPSEWDNINVEECCRIDNPQYGVWHVTVSGQLVVCGPQPYAYAITGNITSETGISEIPVDAPNRTIGFIVSGSITKDIIAMEITLPEKRIVEIDLFDVSGRKVETLCHAEFPDGESSVNYHMHLPSGVYFVKLVSGDYAETKKVLLVR